MRRVSGVSCTAASSGHMVAPSCHHSTALSQACFRIHKCHLHQQYFIKQILYLLLSPSPDGRRSHGAGPQLGASHRPASPPPAAVRGLGHRAWWDQARICRHMNTTSGMPHQYRLLCVKCGASHTVAGQTCIWASCGDIGCWHHNLLVTAGALLWLWVGCCEWDKYSDTDQRSAPTLHLVHTSFLLCS